jgi:hypothetical protein
MIEVWSLVIVFLNEHIQIVLQFAERLVSIASDSRGEKFRAKDVIEVFAGLVVHPAAWIEGTVLNVRSGQERFKRMNGR